MEENMQNVRVYKNGWLITFCIILTILLLPILLGQILWDTSYFSRLIHTYGSEFARVVNMSQVFLALPLGLLDLILGFVILRRKPSKKGKAVAIIAIVLGVPAIMTGLFWLLFLSGLFGQVY